MSSITTSPLICLRRFKTSSPFSIAQKTRVTRLNWRGGRRLTPLCSASPSQAPMEAEGWEEWLKKLPEKKKPIYSHSLPCIEAWLKSLGFYQSRDDRSVWFVEKPNWHAKLSLDITDLYIRYLKSGPGNLEKDIERRFSYALSREDIENAILGGP
ncbi:tRNA dimethylallyltransferase [Rhynchospora pubera]|uniref:tRNA dimethylallyltransferase n=1 Tax=Rhynchospora pubera TaxID=906938 RepID=A0AAV8DWV7_9POAL|nr:tRNA dimethylallyltransferase [Rhynchospora pubera]KAJ4780693.1 tRNA dimethylallyltransferase [Rhynchospora pubera]